jgi:hypothetical protein
MEEKTIDLPILESFFSFRSHRLQIDEKMISYRGQTIVLDEIHSPIYGSIPIRLDMFNIGISHKIGVKDKSGKDILISLKSYFGGYKEEHNRYFGLILDLLWDKISTRLINERIDLLEQGQTFKVGKCEISQEGISIEGSGLIGWGDCSYQKHYNKLAINSKKNHNLYTNLFYYETWDAFIFLGILEWLLDGARHEYLTEK